MTARPFSPLDHVSSHRLPGGLRLFLKEDHTTPLVSAHAWVRVGSVDEEDSIAGISHVLEHMVFKGTAHHSAAEISRWVEAMGGGINAETAKEYTHYYIDVPSAGAARAIQLLGEILHRSTLDPVEWERECPVILEEIKRRNDDPDVLVWDMLSQAVYQDPRLKRSVIGSPETVAGITRDQLWNYYRKFYTAGRCVVVIAGDFEAQQMKSWVEEAFDDMPEGEGVDRPHFIEAGYRPQEMTIRKTVQQTYAAYGFPTPPSSHPDHEALDLLATILGDGRNSRLVNTLREEKKIVWSISAANFSQDSPGLFGIFMECDAKKRSKLRPAVESILHGLKKKLPTDAEMQRAKNITQNAWLQSFETYHNQASTLGLFALENHLDRLDHYLPKLLKLTRADLKTVIDRYIEALPLSQVTVYE